MFRKLLLAVILTSPLAAQDFHAFLKDTFEAMLRENPEMATGIGRNEYNDRWTDWSKPARDRRHQFYVDRLQALRAFASANLSPADRTTYQLVEFDFQMNLQTDDVNQHVIRVGQLFGFHNSAYQIFDRMPARTVKDYSNIIARIRAVPAYVDQHIDLLNESIARKLTQPKLVVDLVNKQLLAQIAQDADHTAVLECLKKIPANIPQAEQDRIRREARAAYNESFLPAWRKLQAYISTTYSANVRPADSISSLPNGRAIYATMVHRMTTTNLSPEEIHKIGLSEVDRIEAEMRKTLAAAGFKGSIHDFEEQIKNSPEQHFQSKDEMLAYCRNIAKIIEPQLPNQFRKLPMLLYGVRPIPADREAATATNAQAPTPDFSVPGWFNLNTYEPGKQVKYDKESLVLHEAVPGHIFQITLAHSQEALPDIRKFYGNSAYTEGWALYAEQLGDQLGLYKDPYSRFGQLASERFRAVRLVVDTGIHHYGWTRAQAVDFFATHAPDEPVAEIDRYISWPGQALAYKMGQLRIRELRTKAEKALGPKFDIREFHDAVLKEGILPLDLLNVVVDRYIAAAGH